MDILENFIEAVVNFIRQYVVKFVINKVLDWLWKKMKPKLLKVGKKLWQMLKDKLRKMKKKWTDFRKRHKERVNARKTLTLIFMNEYWYDNHSYEVLIMIIATQKQMTMIIVISLK